MSRSYNDDPHGDYGEERLRIHLRAPLASRATNVLLRSRPVSTAVVPKVSEMFLPATRTQQMMPV
jgi:hypothetical protein